LRAVNNYGLAAASSRGSTCASAAKRGSRGHGGATLLRGLASRNVFADIAHQGRVARMRQAGVNIMLRHQAATNGSMA